MKSLIAIVNEVNNLERALIESEGAITPEIESMLAIKDLQLPEKVDSYQFIMNRLELVESGYKMQADLFLRASKTLGNAKESMKERLKLAMQEMGVDELYGNDFRFMKLKTTGTLHINDEDSIPIDYKSARIVTDIDKKSIKKDLENGKVVPGAALEPGHSLRCYVNTNVKDKK